MPSPTAPVVGGANPGSAVLTIIPVPQGTGDSDKETVTETVTVLLQRGFIEDLGQVLQAQIVCMRAKSGFGFVLCDFVICWDTCIKS